MEIRWICAFEYTDKIWNQTAVRISSGRELERGLAIRPNISLSSSACVDVVIVSNVEYGVSEHEQC